METRDTLIAWMYDAHQRCVDLVSDLSPEQLIGPFLPTVNPLRWEIAHASYFYSYWVLRHRRGEKPIMANEDELFDSINIMHTTRWNLPVPGIEDVLAYTRAVHQRVAEGLSEADYYLTRYAIFHEDMHGEAFTYTRQTLAYPQPKLPLISAPQAGGLAGDSAVPGGKF